MSNIEEIENRINDWKELKCPYNTKIYAIFNDILNELKEIKEEVNDFKDTNRYRGLRR